MAGNVVNDCPLQFLPKHERKATSHEIIIDDFMIRLQMRGVISYFKTRLPTEDEIDLLSLSIVMLWLI
jgi:hypothetical protein